jgi:hypothetical protein
VRLSCYHHHHHHHHLYCLAFTSPNQQQTEARAFLARSIDIGHLLPQILHINSFRRAATNTATTEGREKNHQHTFGDLSPLTTPLLHGFPETYPAVLTSLLAPRLVHIGGEKALSFLRLPCHNYSASQERTRNQLCRKNSLGLMTPLLKIT